MRKYLIALIVISLLASCTTSNTNDVRKHPTIIGSFIYQKEWKPNHLLIVYANSSDLAYQRNFEKFTAGYFSDNYDIKTSTGFSYQIDVNSMTFSDIMKLASSNNIDGVVFCGPTSGNSNTTYSAITVVSKYYAHTSIVSDTIYDYVYEFNAFDSKTEERIIRSTYSAKSRAMGKILKGAAKELTSEYYANYYMNKK